MIQLRLFEETDIPRLIGWIPDARFLLQWAGPKYVFPLDAVQLRATMATTTGDRPAHFMFKALRETEGDVIGHIELMSVNYNQKTAVLGRVLIGNPAGRGQGWGRAMVEKALRYAFETLALDSLLLNVFDFNLQAIACYRALGFSECERKPNARQFGNESWNLVLMQLRRDEWIENTR